MLASLEYHKEGSMWQAIWAVTRRCRPDTLQVLKENPPTEENYPSAPAAQLTALNIIAASKPKVRIEDVKDLVNEGCRWVNLFGMPLLFSYPSGLLLRNQDPMATTTIALRSNRKTKTTATTWKDLLTTSKCHLVPIHQKTPRPVLRRR